MKNRATGLSKITVIILCAILANCSTKKAREDAQMYYMNGDYALAYEELFPLAKRGDPEAQYTLAYMYYYGQGVAKNEDTARSWMRKSANKGNPRAKYALQLMLENGYSKFTTHPIDPRQPVLMQAQYGAVDKTESDINWIRQQNPQQYTLVLMPTENSSRLANLLKQKNDNRTVSYAYRQNGQLTKALAFGSYSTSELAEASKNKLDQDLKKVMKLAKWEDIQNVMLP